MIFTIIIPCFNEEENINNLFYEIINSLSSFKYEVIIIDDCSTDNSYEVINKFKNIENLVVIKNKINMGQSFSLYEGVKLAKTNTIVTLDCDGQNDPRDIKRLLDLYFKNKDIFLVGGIRNKRMDNIIKILSSKFANYIRNFILRDECADTGCSLKVFDKDTFLKFPFFDGIHRFIPALFKGANKKGIYINVNHRKRLYGDSKYGTIKRALKGISDIIKVIKIIKHLK